MSTRPGTPGATRQCPHCKSTVLESAAVCPACQHHLRFQAGAGGASEEGYRAFSIDGSFTPRGDAESSEFCVILDMRNERGEQVARQVVAVGALRAGEVRHLNVSVGMRPIARGAPVTVTPTAATAPRRPEPSPARPTATSAGPVPPTPPSPASPGTTGSRPRLFRRY